MNYHTIYEYIEAIKCAKDDIEQLGYLIPVLDNDGLPLMKRGNDAVVFKMKDEDTGKTYAAKCFLKEQEGRSEAYLQIADEIKYNPSSYLVPVEYLDDALYIKNDNNDSDFWAPVLLMDWIEGKTMEDYIRDHMYDDFKLSLLAYQFSRFAIWILSQPFAHGDLNTENIFVKDDGTLVLVDYDGMFVPAMYGQKARELGSPDFSHPSRTEEEFDEHIDDFSLISILLSLKAISLQPNLLDEFGNSKRLLFSNKDYCNILQSKILDALYPSKDSEINVLMGVFMITLVKTNLSDVSFKLLNLNRPQKSDYEWNTRVTKNDLANAWIDEFGVMYSSDKKRLLKAPQNLKDYSILEGTEVICDGYYRDSSYTYWNIELCRKTKGAFFECSSLNSVTIPNSVKKIGHDAFYSCFFKEY